MIDAYYREELLPADLLHLTVRHGLEPVLEGRQQTEEIIAGRYAFKIKLPAVNCIFDVHGILPNLKVTYYR